MNHEAVDIIKEVLNRVIMLAQTEQAYVNNALTPTLRATAQIKLTAYNEVINILQATLSQG